MGLCGLVKRCATDFDTVSLFSIFKMKNLIVIFWFCLAVNCLNAQLSVGKMFDNNMVLQREKPIHIFGKGIPTEGVSVETMDGSIQDVSTIVKKRKILIETPLKIKRILYGWKPFSDGNLMNKVGLPCSTFCILIQ